MGEFVTQAECRGYQGECKGDVLQEIKSVGEKIDGVVREVAELRGDVRVIKDRLGIAEGDVKVHHRPDDQAPHEHLRQEDSVRGWLMKRWREVLLIITAGLAGERILTEVPKLLRELFK